MARPGLFAVDSLTGIHVLLVDDDPASQAEIVAVLRYCGALLTVADSDGAAIRALDLVKPDVVIIAVPRRQRGEIMLVRVVRARKPEAGGVVPIVAILHAGEALVPNTGVTLEMSRPLDAWRICRELARLVSEA